MENNEKNVNNGEATEGQKATNKKGANKTVSEPKKEGWFKTTWRKHKKAILGFAGGLATGVGGSALVAEYGKRQMAKKQITPPQEFGVNPLDPNL